MVKLDCHKVPWYMSERNPVLEMVFIMAIVFVGIIIASYFMDNKPNYTIYKTECHNETRLLYQKVVEVSWFIDSNISSVLLNNKDAKVKVNGRDVFMNCTKSSTYIESDGKMVEIPNDFYYLCNFYDNEEVCNNIEVKKIDLSEAFKTCWKDNISEEDFNLCTLLLDRDVDITQKWLDNNCEGCMANQEGKCNYYKCDDYSIEVK